MRRYLRWTEEQIRMLQELFNAGCDVTEMSRAMNRDVPSIRAKLNVLDLKVSDRTVEPNYAEFSRLMELHSGRAPE